MRKSDNIYPTLPPLTKGRNFKGATTLPPLTKEGLNKAKQVSYSEILPLCKGELVGVETLPHLTSPYKGEEFQRSHPKPLLTKEGRQVVTGILTISDRCAKGLREDEGGPCLKRLVLRQGWRVVKYEIVPDDLNTIAKTLKSWCRQNGLNVILTTGGTGVGPRDVTPEATTRILEKELPGIPEQLRREGTKHTPFATLSRAKAGVRGKTLIINLPGSPKSLEESFPVLERIIPHAIEMIAGKDH